MTQRKSQNLFVCMAGAHGTGKSTLMNMMLPEVEKLVKQPVAIIDGVGRIMKEKGFVVDQGATFDSKWAIEAEYLRIEQELREKPKLASRSVIDRFAYARAGNIDMDLHFSRVLPAYVNLEYDLILYVPIEERVVLVADGVRNPDPIFQRRVDHEIRRIIREYQIPVQVVKGSVEERCSIALEALRIKLGR